MRKDVLGRLSAGVPLGPGVFRLERGVVECLRWARFLHRRSISRNRCLRLSLGGLEPAQELDSVNEQICVLFLGVIPKWMTSVQYVLDGEAALDVP